MNKLMQRILFLTVLSGISLSVSAQDWEFGIMVGGSNYHGDLAYNIVPSETHAAYGLHYRYNFNPYWSWRPSVMYGQISGSDANYKEYALRNLSFHSHIWEISSIFEFNFLPFGSRILSKDVSSYVMLGLAGYRFNPTTEYRGTVIDLRPLRTEGQNNKEIYSRIQMSVPFGGGIKFNLNRSWVAAIEIGWRKVFTDYLDDVSTEYPDQDIQRDLYGDLSAQLSDRSWEIDGVGEPLSLEGDMRGDPALKDFYFFTTLNISYRLNPITCWPKYKKPYLFR